MTLLEAAQAKNAADKAYRSAFISEMHTLKPMDDSPFLAVLDCLIAQVKESRSRGKDVESAMDSFRAGLIFGCGWGTTPPADWPDTKAKRWEAMARFGRRYEVLKATLSKLCYELKGLERGDDGYGDFIDSLPLAGRAVLDGLIQEDIANYKQLEKALADNPLKDFILNGENYIAMKMEEMLCEAYTQVARELTPPDEDDRPRENPHVVVNVTRKESPDRWSRDTVGLTLTVSGPFRDEYEAGKFVKQNGKECHAVRLYHGIVEK